MRSPMVAMRLVFREARGETRVTCLGPARQQQQQDRATLYNNIAIDLLWKRRLILMRPLPSAAGPHCDRRVLVCNDLSLWANFYLIHWRWCWRLEQKEKLNRGTSELTVVHESLLEEDNADEGDALLAASEKVWYLRYSDQYVRHLLTGDRHKSLCLTRRFFFLCWWS